MSFYAVLCYLMQIYATYVCYVALHDEIMSCSDEYCVCRAASCICHCLVWRCCILGCMYQCCSCMYTPGCMTMNIVLDSVVLCRAELCEHMHVCFVCMACAAHVLRYACTYACVCVCVWCVYVHACTHACNCVCRFVHVLCSHICIRLQAACITVHLFEYTYSMIGHVTYTATCTITSWA